ncbi:ABC transporter substrate-binding protein [Canibacter sp. lx-72]|uniref:ABC transporter substrate-binding protein n=1 Tax=Canibacter zhuwentaonis TaxID=2837491 RepID=UPI001BDCA030|nr:ABC transporter substrate-binding protein [Canibacter zhuwentaonis]MBT1017545.1 ABC transporter substrate-binding protein [Canibacter zhuwentaonis]
MSQSQNNDNALSEKYQKRTQTKQTKPLLIALAAIATLTLILVAAFALNSDRAKPQNITVGLVLEPTNLNIRETAGVALDQILLDNVYQGLIALKPGTVNEYVPKLAASLPEVSADGKSYSFKLRSGVKFHDGSEFDSEDVVHSLTRGLNKEKLKLGGVEVKATGKYAVTVNLNEPNAMLNWLLAGRNGIIFSSTENNDLNNTAIGTGPFTLAQWQQGDRITLAKNENYWSEAAKLANVTFRFIPDGRAAVNALKDGTLDVHTALGSNLRDEFANNTEYKLVRASSTDVFTLAYNSNRAPFNNPDIRRAVSMAIDTDAIIQSQNGGGLPLGSPITELETGYKDLTAINAYDPQKAREVLTANGLSGSAITITAPNFYDQAPLDIIIEQLRAVGFDAKLELVEFSTWLKKVYSDKDYDISYVDHAEANDFANYTNPAYYFGFNSPEVAKLYKKSLLALDTKTQEKLLTEAATLVAEQAPAKWLYNYTPTLVIRNGVTGFPTANTNSRLNMEDVTAKK